MDAIDFNNINETALFFQAGYLTIEKEFSENEQIHKKDYWLPYEGSRISLFALAFKDEKIDKNAIITCKM